MFAVVMMYVHLFKCNNGMAMHPTLDAVCVQMVSHRVRQWVQVKQGERLWWEG